MSKMMSFKCKAMIVFDIFHSFTFSLRRLVHFQSICNSLFTIVLFGLFDNVLKNRNHKRKCMMNRGLSQL